VESNSADEIRSATRELLLALVDANSIAVDDIASVWFVVTPDLTAAFPSAAARDLGWRRVALLDAMAIPVPGSLPRCIRVLMHWNTSRTPGEIHHVYTRRAAALRPDLAAPGHARPPGRHATAD
jgi:chorismate mutase